MSSLNRNEAAGGALVAGYLVVLATLSRAPASALAVTTTGPRPLLYFLVLPVAGILAGLYAYVDGPFSAVPLFVLGSYLGFLGLALSLGALLSATPVSLPLAVGLVGLALAVLALVAGLLRFVELFQFGSIGIETD